MLPNKLACSFLLLLSAMLLPQVPSIGVIGVHPNIATDAEVELFLAAQNGQVAVVKELLERGTSPLISLNDGTTLLYVACQNGYADVVALLLSHNAAVDVANDDGATPLYIASQHAHMPVIRLLLSHKASINKGTKTGATPLYIASQNGNYAAARLLLEHNALVDSRGDKDTTALFIASDRGQTEVVKLLLSYGAVVDRTRTLGMTPLYIASFNGHEAVVEVLLQQKASVDKADDNGVTPLYVASQNGNDGVVRRLISHGASVDKDIPDGYTPLYIASQKGNEGVVKLLLEHHASVNKTNKFGISPLFAACSNGGNDAIVKMLLERNASPDAILANPDVYELPQSTIELLERYASPGGIRGRLSRKKQQQSDLEASRGTVSGVLAAIVDHSIMIGSVMVVVVLVACFAFADRLRRSRRIGRQRRRIRKLVIKRVEQQVRPLGPLNEKQADQPRAEYVVRGADSHDGDGAASIASKPYIRKRRSRLGAEERKKREQELQAQAAAKEAHEANSKREATIDQPRIEYVVRGADSRDNDGAASIASKPHTRKRRSRLGAEERKKREQELQAQAAAKEAHEAKLRREAAMAAIAAAEEAERAREADSMPEGYEAYECKAGNQSEKKRHRRRKKKKQMFGDAVGRTELQLEARTATGSSRPADDEREARTGAATVIEELNPPSGGKPDGLSEDTVVQAEGDHHDASVVNRPSLEEPPALPDDVAAEVDLRDAIVLNIPSLKEPPALPYNVADAAAKPAPKTSPAPTEGSPGNRPQVHYECVICMEDDQPAEYACLPCGHRCLCGECRQLELKACPVCREELSGIVRIFL